MDRPKTDEEIQNFLNAVNVVAAHEWVKHDPLLATTSRFWDIVSSYQTHEPFKAAIRAAFYAGMGEGRIQGYFARKEEEKLEASPE